MHKRFFGNMNITEIKTKFLENDFSEEEIRQIEMGEYDPYKIEGA